MSHMDQHGFRKTINKQLIIKEINKTIKQLIGARMIIKVTGQVTQVLNEKNIN